ncbi:LuxR C-terminal-related transcriptional regulator [Cellulomonas sp.]|uniref:LuxR C-terminal-related transcriptional regulator n=1 Tax=Cellulomonas sp. TaxID=40001 RepID=UPI003BAADA5C
MTRSGSGGPHPADAATSFYGSRLHAPPTPARYLRRPRLVELLDQATSAPITVVVAPAGSGKTSLLADWISSAAVPTAWVSVDETDRDGGQLWAGVTVALGELVDGLTTGVRGARRPGTPAAAVAVLLSGLEHADHPDSAVLIIDDVHLVDDDEGTVRSMALFLTSVPAWLHVVLLSRRTPKLPIDRLRVRGQLSEVQFAELRFSPEEAECMLARLDASLAQDEVGEVVDRAGGWAAGLQLSALASRSDRAQPAAMPRADTRGLLFADYVWREVLGAERPDVVEVLLDTCVAKRTDASLATALTGRSDAGELLLEAEARGLFVTRLGPSGWFEVHAVVRDELLAEAARRSPQRVAAQHARAARWFEDAGEVATALEHWILAGRPRDALRLLAGRVEGLYDSGREATIARTLALIPLNLASTDLQALIEFAWCHLLVDKRRFLETVRAGAARERPDGENRTQTGRLTMLQSVAATVTGDWSRSRELTTESMVLLGEDVRTDELGRFGWNLLAREAALSERWDDDSGQLEQVRLELGTDPERRLRYEGIHALGEALAGRPLDALRIAAGVRDVVAVGSMTILSAELGIAEALAHRELGDRARALTELTSSSPPWRDPVTHAQCLAMLQLTELRLDDGDVAAADACFEGAHEFVRSEFAGPGGLMWLARTGTVLCLAAGRIAEAQTWAERVDDPFWGGVGLARVRLAQGGRADAEALLDRVAPRCPRHEVVRDLLRARAAESHPLALEWAARAISLATGVGLVQTVASEGTEILELLEVQAVEAPRVWLDRVRRAASPHATTSVVDPSPPGEHLTEREIGVLRMLPSRLTLPEIADELYISVNTLKFHLRVIYRKLGVGSRLEAAEVARHLHSESRARVSGGVHQR